MRRLTTLAALAAAGLVISLCLTYSHYQPAALACTTNSLVDCGAVTGSRWSVIPGTGLPVAIAGAAYFAVSLAAALASRRRDPPGLRIALLAWSGLALLFVLILVYAELVLVHRLCEWCTAVHALVLICFLLSLNRVQEIGSEPAGT